MARSQAPSVRFRPAIVAQLKGYYELWAADELKRRGSTPAIPQLLRLPSAVELLRTRCAGSTGA